MGNCQAAETARVVLQHPGGKEEKVSWGMSASYVMKMNPGHYVCLLISTTSLPAHGALLRLTRIKLLRPTDTLRPGHVYRLITTKEVMKGLMTKKSSKLKRKVKESVEKLDIVKVRSCTELDNDNQIMKTQEKERKRISRSWQPSLQSISEGGSS